jgi:hypothetical protein
MKYFSRGGHKYIYPLLYFSLLAKIKNSSMCVTSFSFESKSSKDIEKMFLVLVDSIEMQKMSNKVDRGYESACTAIQ